MLRMTHRPFCLMVLLTLFLVKSFVPLGFMPSFMPSTNSGSFAQTITICSGTDEIQIFVDAEGHKIEQPASSHPAAPDHQSVCEFSLASIFSPTAEPPLTFINTAIDLIPYNQFVFFDFQKLHAHTFEATGPPALV